MDLSDAIWKITTQGLDGFNKDNSRFIISGWLRELWFRRIEEAKNLYLENNTLFNSDIPAEKLFEENSEGYKYVMEYADKSIGKNVFEDEDFHY
jgi:hypothetical protein